MPREDGFALPTEVRRIRGWWLREARYHLRRVREGAPYREWHVGQAAQARRYARGVVEQWFAHRGDLR
jgi:hypothetical protein